MDLYDAIERQRLARILRFLVKRSALDHKQIERLTAEIHSLQSRLDALEKPRPHNHHRDHQID
jgi:hypothetical protein